MAKFEDAYRSCIEYFRGDELASTVFITKYALCDKDGDYHESTPDDMHKRLAKEFARIEKKYQNPMSETEIYNLLKDFRYVIPQGSPMSGIGNPFQIQSISNCFVVESPHDSYGGILKTDQELVQIAKRRGGVGFDLSSIRPKGLSTGNCARTTDGIEVFMDRFSNSCREVAQGGRRGALMITVSVHHPQIRDFTKIKKDLNFTTSFRDYLLEIELPLLGFTVGDLINLDIKDKKIDWPNWDTQKIINKIGAYFRDFPQKIMEDWIKYATDFLSEIGFKLPIPIPFTFCAFLEAIGVPKEINLKNALTLNA